MSSSIPGSSELTGEICVVQSQAVLVDPHVNTDDRDKLSLLFSVYEALVRRSAKSGYEPSLAVSWTVDDRARVWTFRLRAGVRFHNGLTLQPADVIASLNRVRNPRIKGELGTQGVYQSYLQDASFEIAGKDEVRIVLGQPMADLLDLVVDLAIIPAANLEGTGALPIGSGRYRVLEQSENQVLLGAFDSYWGAKANYRRVRWRGEPDDTQRLHILLNGAADIVSDITPSGHLAANDPRLRSAPSSVCTAFMCNVKGGGVTANASVRKALNHALDVPRLINEILPGKAVPLTGPLTSRHFGHDGEVPALHHDKVKARELLAEAGYSTGIKLTLDVPSRLPDEAPALAHAMARQYSEVGIETVVIEHQDREAYALLVRDGLLNDAACFDSSPLSTYRVFREKFHSGHRGPWWLGYERTEVDLLIDRAQATVDEKIRQRLYRRAYRLISADAPWIFLYNHHLTWGVGSKLSYWTPPLDGRIIL